VRRWCLPSPLSARDAEVGSTYRRHFTPRRNRALDALPGDRTPGLRPNLRKPLRPTVGLGERLLGAEVIDDRTRDFTDLAVAANATLSSLPTVARRQAFGLVLPYRLHGAGRSGCNLVSEARTLASRRQPKPKEVPVASTVEIAPGTEADLPLLFGLAKGAYLDVPGWSDERVLEVLTNGVTFVAREHGQPGGYVALRRNDSGPIVIEQLFVAPGHEQHGIGHRLLAHAEGYAIAERRHSLQIIVEESNRQARSFYRRSGFVPLEPELFELILPRTD
jgi:ribosomal protein S18 acetylase RimI-like enzyme